MADEQIQQLERAWRASGSVEDGARWLRERLRAGVLSRGAVRLASYLGSEVAAAALDGAAVRPSPMQRQSAKVWIEGMLELASPTWRDELSRRVMAEGTAINVRAATAAALSKRRRHPAPVRKALEQLALAAKALPGAAAVRATREAIGEVHGLIAGKLRSEQAARDAIVYAEDPEEDEALRRYADKERSETGAGRLDGELESIGFDLDALVELTKTGAAPPDHRLRDVLDAIPLDTDASEASRKELGATLVEWLLGPGGPAAAGERDATEVVAMPLPAMADAELVIALQKLELRSPVKRMLVTQLARDLATNKSLSEAQREKALAIYREHGPPGGSSR